MSAVILTRQIIPKINIHAYAAMNATNVDDRLSIQENPHVVITEKRVGHGSNEVLSQLKLNFELHTKV